MKVASDVVLSFNKCIDYEQHYSDGDMIKNLSQNIFHSYLNIYFAGNNSPSMFRNIDSLDHENFTKIVERRFVTLRQIFCRSNEFLGSQFVSCINTKCAEFSKILEGFNMHAGKKNSLQNIDSSLSQINHLVLLGTFLVFGHSKLCFHYLDYSFSGFEDFKFAQISDRQDVSSISNCLLESFKDTVLSNLLTLHTMRKQFKQLSYNQTLLEFTIMAEACFLGTLCLEALHSSVLIDYAPNPGEYVGSLIQNKVFTTNLGFFNQVLQKSAGWTDYTNAELSGKIFMGYLESTISGLVNLLNEATTCRASLYILSALSSILDKIKNKLKQEVLTSFPVAKQALETILNLRNKFFGSEMSKETREFRKGVYSFIGRCVFEDDTDDFLPNIMKYGDELFTVMLTPQSVAANPKGSLLNLFAIVSGMLDAVCSPRVAACILKIFYPRVKLVLESHCNQVSGDSEFVEGLFSFYKSLNIMTANQLTRSNCLLALQLVKDTCNITVAIMGPLYDRLKACNTRQIITALKENTDVIVDTVRICSGLLCGGSMDIASLEYFGDPVFFSYFQLVFKIVGLLVPYLDVGFEVYS
jgi:hypothetical protein